MDVGKLLTTLFFILVAVVAIIVFITISGRFLPNDCKLEIGGQRQSILGSLGNCVQKCWSKHDFGNDLYNDDCYVIKVSSKSEITRKDMEGFLGGKIPTRIYFDKIPSGSNFRLKVKYNVTSPEISISKFCDIVKPSYDDLISCKGNVVVANIKDKIIFIGDSTPLADCCNDNTADFEKLMLNTAKYLGGKRIQIFYEDPGADPNEKQRLIESLRNEGFDVRFFLHKVQFKPSDMDGFDQLWFFRPGICSNPEFKDICMYEWTDTEFEDVKDYLITGKIVIVTDYPPLVPVSVSNKIVKFVDPNVTVSDVCHCGCGPPYVAADKIAKHPITNGIDTYIIEASAVIEPLCI